MIKFNLEGKIKELGVTSPKELIRKILHEVSLRLDMRGNHIISYIIVDNEEIHKINLEYRGIDRPTDVITFAAIDDEKPGKIPEELGDILRKIKKVICCFPSLFYWSAKLQKSLGYSHTRGLKTNNHTIINLLMEQMLSNDYILFFIAFLSRVRAFGLYPISMLRLTCVSCLPTFGSTMVSTPSAT